MDISKNQWRSTGGLCLCYIYLVVNPIDISTPDYSNKCFEIPQQETNSVNSCR